MTAVELEPGADEPSGVGALEEGDRDVGEEEMPMFHGAEIEEGVEGHWGISKEASMA